jgi:hypothetical protein
VILVAFPDGDIRTRVADQEVPVGPPDQAIVPAPALEDVRPRPTGDLVSTRPAAQRLVLLVEGAPFPTAHEVVAAQRTDDVAPTPGEYDVAHLRSDDDVGSRGPDDRGGLAEAPGTCGYGRTNSPADQHQRERPKQ